MRKFYGNYFNAQASELYHNTKTGFHSYFLTFESGARLEIMYRQDITHRIVDGEILGFAHLAIALGNKEKVDALTKQLIEDGYECLSPSRTTGDGYYESVIADPEGNRIEITA